MSVLDQFSLEGKRALVTGASRGLGRAMAIALAEAGADVVCASSNQGGADDTAKSVQSLGRTAWTTSADLADRQAVRRMAEDAQRQAGAIDILINNAGITRDTTFHKMTALQWQEVINTNLNSVFNMTRPVIEGMRNRKWGRIVQISSINGQKGQYGQANYAAAKAGMHGFTISLAQENAKFGITVNTVSPGYVGTDMVMAVPEDVRAKIVAQIPLGRLGEPDEIAYAVGFFVGDKAQWITGANLAINGGQYMGW